MVESGELHACPHRRRRECNQNREFRHRKNARVPQEKVTNQELLVRKQRIAALLKMKREDQERRQCEESLLSFLKSAWLVLEPGTPFVPGWHIEAICEHLEAAATGQIRRLIINVPPRSSKSTIFSQCFPAWIWIKQPEKRFVYTSYDLKLSKRDSQKCRQLIKSNWYQSHWGEAFKISRVQDAAFRFENDRNGFRIASSVDAGITGEGGDFICGDDINDINQMNSDTYIQSVIDYHDGVLASRLNDPKRGVRIHIQQRSHERDISGHILSREQGWTLLVIPMEYEGKKKPNGIGWTDPRTQEGELMCPERMGPLEVEQAKTTMGALAWAGQYQQRPSPGEGAKFKREWWKFYNEPGVSTKPIFVKLPGGKSLEREPVERPIAFEQVVQAWDMAFKEHKDTDFVAGHAWGRVGANVYLLKRRSERMDFPKTIAAVREMTREFPCPEKLVEDKANGPAVIQTLRNEIPGLIASPIQSGLEQLATAHTGYAEAGNIYLPNPDLNPWVWDFIEQFAVYPRGQHDDDVSAAAHAWRRLFDSVANSATPEFRVVPRANEPATANHVEADENIQGYCQPHWKRWIAVAAGHPGAALWICRTPSGALRVLRELSLNGVDANEAGRLIAEASLSDIRAALRSVHITAKFSVDLLMEKECFAPIEPIGCYAEMLEQGMAEFEPTTGTFAEREAGKRDIRHARVSSDMVTMEDSAWDRLRELLRFAPPEFAPISYNRTESFRLAKQDHEAWRRYMAATEGEVHGEYPKLKISSKCIQTVGAMGTAKRGEDTENPFLRALLIGVQASESIATPKMREIPATPQFQPQWNPRRGRRAG